MPESRPLRPSVDRLVRYLFGGSLDDGLDEGLADEMAEWLVTSPRFRSFADAHRDKIRKKLRGAGSAAARLDVRAELRTAQLLLADRRIELGFETYGSGRPGPDFTVALSGERTFNLEVTRLHGTAGVANHGGPILAKLHQLPPSAPNALLIATEGPAADAPGDAIDMGAVEKSLRSRADRKDDAFFEERGFRGSRGFYQRYTRLGAVLLWAEAADGDARATAWTNRLARIAVPPRALDACVRLLRNG